MTILAGAADTSILEMLNLEHDIEFPILAKEVVRLWEAFQTKFIEDHSFPSIFDQILATNDFTFVTDEYFDAVNFANCVRIILERWTLFIIEMATLVFPQLFLPTACALHLLLECFRLLFFDWMVMKAMF
jgi:hypothetical protein